MVSQLLFVSPAVTAYALGCVFVAALARGFSGFGFTLLAIMSLSFVLPLSTIVPAMFVLEIAAGLKLLPSIWGHVHWRSIRVLVVTSILATPVGAYLLASLPGDYVKVILAVLIVMCCLALITGFKLQRMPWFLQTVATGAGAGVLNGSLGLGGPPVIVFFLGTMWERPCRSAGPVGWAAQKAGILWFLHGRRVRQAQMSPVRAKAVQSAFRRQEDCAMGEIRTSSCPRPYSGKAVRLAQ